MPLKNEVIITLVFLFHIFALRVRPIQEHILSDQIVWYSLYLIMLTSYQTMDVMKFQFSTIVT